MIKMTDARDDAKLNIFGECPMNCCASGSVPGRLSNLDSMLHLTYLITVSIAPDQWMRLLEARLSDTVERDMPPPSNDYIRADSSSSPTR